MTSRRPYWCPKTMKRRPCWCPKPVLWELNSFLTQTLSFAPINLHICWPRERKHSIWPKEIQANTEEWTTQTAIYCDTVTQMQKFMCYCTAFAFSILNMRAISEYKPPGAYIWRGYLSDGFLRYEFGGLMFGGGLYMDGLIFRTFTVLAFITVTKNYRKPTNKLFEFIKAFIKSLVDNCLRVMFSDSILW